MPRASICRPTPPAAGRPPARARPVGGPGARRRRRGAAPARPAGRAARLQRSQISALMAAYQAAPWRASASRCAGGASTRAHAHAVRQIHQPPLLGAIDARHRDAITRRQQAVAGVGQPGSGGRAAGEFGGNARRHQLALVVGGKAGLRDGPGQRRIAQHGCRPRAWRAKSSPRTGAQPLASSTGAPGNQPGLLRWYHVEHIGPGVPAASPPPAPGHRHAPPGRPAPGDLRSVAVERLQPSNSSFFVFFASSSSSLLRGLWC